MSLQTISIIIVTRILKKSQETSYEFLPRVERMQKKSLVGIIQRNWENDGHPPLTWNGLLQRTIAADAELERGGDNPAGVFRKRRYSKDTKGMLRYIRGFYRYEFCPSHSPERGTRELYIPDSLFRKLRVSAREAGRSTSDQAIYILRKALE